MAEYDTREAILSLGKTVDPELEAVRISSIWPRDTTQGQQTNC